MGKGGRLLYKSCIRRTRICRKQAQMQGTPKQLTIKKWIDSCCIDKTSSAELSEAINSMFKWYQKAQVCYAYLSDVASARQNPSDRYSDFRLTKWFTRGWTLQELLAPSSVEFCDCNWVEIGTKLSLQNEVSKVTGISIEHLQDYSAASVAQKLSWASLRATTRREDEAYCLMGLFDVNMPTLYGEGDKAFLRLQLEILSQTDDESLFAWENDGPHSSREIKYDEIERRVYFPKIWSGLLAERVSWFEHSSQIGCAGAGNFALARRPPVLTNRGLSISFPIITSIVLREHGEAFIPLNCAYETQGGKYASSKVIALRIFQAGDGIWKRHPDKLFILHTLLLGKKGNGVFNTWKLSPLSNKQSLVVLEPENEPMYFPLITKSSRFEGQPTPPRYLTVNLDTLVANNFNLQYRYIKFLGQDSEFEIKGHPHQIVREIEQDFRTATVVAYDKAECLPFCLVVAHSDLPISGIILIPLPPDHTPKEIIEKMLPYQNSKTKGFTDRISLKVAESLYVSASLKRFKVDGESTIKEVTYRVEVFVDDYQRWHTPVEDS